MVEQARLVVKEVNSTLIGTVVPEQDTEGPLLRLALVR